MKRRERSDAARNREAVLAAARQLFAERGATVPLAAIADRAGVSRTTLYRHFATREDLAATVLAENVALIEARAAILTGQDGAVLTLLDFVFDMQERNRSVLSVLTTDDARMVDLGERTAAAFEPLVEQARGTLRPGVSAADFLLTLQMAEAGVGEPEVFRRMRELLVRGLIV